MSVERYEIRGEFDGAVFCVDRSCGWSSPDLTGATARQAADVAKRHVAATGHTVSGCQRVAIYWAPTEPGGAS